MLSATIIDVAICYSLVILQNVAPLKNMLYNYVIRITTIYDQARRSIETNQIDPHACAMRTNKDLSTP